MTNDGTFTYTFDADGNRATRTRISTAPANDYKATYSWDPRNRLTDVEDFNNSGTLTEHVHYVYDVFNQLIERDVDPTGGGTYTQVTHYVWDFPLPPVDAAGGADAGQGGIVLQLKGSGQVTARDLNGPNTSAYDQYFSNLAQENVTSPSSPGTVTFNLLDNLGTLRDVVDSTGVLQDHLVYTVYGELAYESNLSVSHLGGFAGGFYDPATGLTNHVNRWYDPAAAVWISADPAGFAAGDANLTRYVGNDTSNQADPSGLFDVAGHFWTTYVVAIAAGRSPAEARKLAYYSQLPDQLAQFDAKAQTESALQKIKEASLRNLWRMFSPGSAHYRARPDVSYERLITTMLHSLHGGDPCSRRKQLAQFFRFAENDGSPAWALGFVLHAYGDAFAHAFDSDANGSDDKGYSFEKAGHLCDAHQPDMIGVHTDAYKAYMRNLFRLLGGDKNDPIAQARLRRILGIADSLQRTVSALSEDQNLVENWWAGYAGREAAVLEGLAKHEFGFESDWWAPTPGVMGTDPAMYTPSREETVDLLGRRMRSGFELNLYDPAQTRPRNISFD